MTASRGNTPGKQRKRKAQKARQRAKAKYAKAREKAQQLGIIETTPDGAVRDERVDPSTQGEQTFPVLDRQAVRKGWAVPEERKPALVERISSVVEDPEAKDRDRVAAFNALQKADRDQWERDNPADAGKAAGAQQGSLLGELSDLLKAAEEARTKVEGRLEDAGAEAGAAEVDAVAAQPDAAGLPEVRQEGVLGQEDA